MLYTGLRLSEVINLKWKDLDLISGKLMVREGKGKKDRTLWLGEEDLNLIQKWKERQVKKIGKTPAHIFTSTSKGSMGNKMNPRYIQYMVKRYSKKARINKDIRPHTLRHRSLKGNKKYPLGPEGTGTFRYQHNNGLYPYLWRRVGGSFEKFKVQLAKIAVFSKNLYYKRPRELFLGCSCTYTR